MEGGECREVGKVSKSQIMGSTTDRNENLDFIGAVGTHQKIGLVIRAGTGLIRLRGDSSSSREVTEALLQLQDQPPSALTLQDWGIPPVSPRWLQGSVYFLGAAGRGAQRCSLPALS